MITSATGRTEEMARLIRASVTRRLCDFLSHPEVNKMASRLPLFFSLLSTRGFGLRTRCRTCPCPKTTPPTLSSLLSSSPTPPQPATLASTLGSSTNTTLPSPSSPCPRLLPVLPPRPPLPPSALTAHSPSTVPIPLSSPASLPNVRPLPAPPTMPSSFLHPTPNPRSRTSRNKNASVPFASSSKKWPTGSHKPLLNPPITLTTRLAFLLFTLPSH